MINIQWIVLLSFVLFSVGIFGILARRNLLFILLSLEIMLNAIALLFIGSAQFHGNNDGQIMYLFIVTLAACEVSIGLALTIQVYRRQQSLDVDKLSNLRN